ncbi:hypothetical protein QBC47DRAFT_360330 [Echria macrotheca]|uniref:Tat pathway signal sequence n=1 Tax=Echria macrotheca TaxID=438768 RepID=A0AAJ0BDQ7_9PEZI|nr:hypothetical protein QBC47DRAFT_360330 [Echria macrotheca]
MAYSRTFHHIANANGGCPRLGIVSTRTSSGNCDGQGYWRDSEFATVTKELPPVYREELFEPTLRFNTSHRIYRPHLTPDYVGTPTPEIDAAWEELIGAVNVFVTPQEASNWKMGGNLWLDPETGLHMAQVSVMHDLHCLDMLRRFIYLDHYPDMDDYTLRPHVEHCLDGLRRSLMCHGDMTFIPIEWSENRGWIMPIFDTVYTCRDYDALRKWTRDRDAADPKVYPQNAERLWLKSSGAVSEEVAQGLAGEC